MANKADFGTGKIVGGEFVGAAEQDDECTECGRGGDTKPPGTYITIRLDNDEASIWPARVLVQEAPDA